MTGTEVEDDEVEAETGIEVIAGVTVEAGAVAQLFVKMSLVNQNMFLNRRQ